MPNPHEEEFSKFINEWSDQFDNIQFILRYLKSYKSKSEKFNRINFTDPNEIEFYQKEWLWLLSRLGNPIEYDFFKPYWIPVENDSYDYFIDLSSSDFPFFSVAYYQNEPYCWYEVPIYDNLSDLMLDLDKKPYVLDQYFERIFDLRMEEFWNLADHGNELGNLGLLMTLMRS
jgi:hypothetical protein